MPWNVPGNERVDRGHIDDGAAAALGHGLDALAAHQKVAADVDVHGLLKGAQVRVLNRPKVRVGRRVVDQDVEPAVLRREHAKHLLDGRRIADVAGERLGRAALRADGRGHHLAALDLAARANHVRAV